MAKWLSTLQGIAAGAAEGFADPTAAGRELTRRRVLKDDLEYDEKKKRMANKVEWDKNQQELENEAKAIASYLETGGDKDAYGNFYNPESALTTARFMQNRAKAADVFKRGNEAIAARASQDKIADLTTAQNEAALNEALTRTVGFQQERETIPIAGKTKRAQLGNEFMGASRAYELGTPATTANAEHFKAMNLRDAERARYIQQVPTKQVDTEVAKMEGEAAQSRLSNAQGTASLKAGVPESTAAAEVAELRAREQRAKTQHAVGQRTPDQQEALRNALAKTELALAEQQLSTAEREQQKNAMISKFINAYNRGGDTIGFTEKELSLYNQLVNDGTLKALRDIELGIALPGRTDPAMSQIGNIWKPKSGISAEDFQSMMTTPRNALE